MSEKTDDASGGSGRIVDGLGVVASRVDDGPGQPTVRVVAVLVTNLDLAIDHLLAAKQPTVGSETAPIEKVLRLRISSAASSPTSRSGKRTPL